MKDNYERNNDTKINSHGMKSQQFYQGGPSAPGRNDDRNRDRGKDRGRGEQPGMMPSPGTPGMGEPPRTAPPSFIPQGPSMERGPMAGPGQEQFRTPERDQYGGGRNQQGIQVSQRDLQRCQNRFTFIWMINGNSFWFYPTFVGRQFVEGFRWRRNRWEFDRINISRIAFFRCF